MRKILSLGAILFTLSNTTFAQEKKEGTGKITVPSVVKSALYRKYPAAKHIAWEKEKGNYEANWAGKSGEDNQYNLHRQGILLKS